MEAPVLPRLSFSGRVSFDGTYRMNMASNADTAIIIVAKAVSLAYRSILLAEQ
jgi:hypothetical protein